MSAEFPGASQDSIGALLLHLIEALLVEGRLQLTEALADAVVMAEMNPAFSSLNLAQAVFCVGYEWLMAAAEDHDSGPEIALALPKETRPANKSELEGLFEHLEGELDGSGFLCVAVKRPVMVRNIRNIFQRAGLTEQEVRTLRGVIASLVTKRGK